MAEEKPKEASQEEDEATGQEPVPTESRKAVDEKDEKLAELSDDLKRLQAEFENFKKRNEREWAERVKLANKRMISDLLMVLDSFDKALEDAKETRDNDCLKHGVEKVQRQFMQILEKEGLREIDTKNGFDPFMHEAVMREERSDAEDGAILEVYQKGYTLDRKTLRPAKVKVAKRPEVDKPLAETDDMAEDGAGEEDEQDEGKQR